MDLNANTMCVWIELIIDNNSFMSVTLIFTSSIIFYYFLITNKFVEYTDCTSAEG